MAVIKCRICGLFHDLDVSSQVCTSCRRNAKERPLIKKDFPSPRTMEGTTRLVQSIGVKESRYRLNGGNQK